MNFEVGNTTVYRELIGGSKEVLITDRAATGTLVIEAEPMSTQVREARWTCLPASLIDTGLGTNPTLRSNMEPLLKHSHLHLNRVDRAT